jgi:hypothetical protein
VVASSADAAKGFGGKDICTPEPPLLQEPSANAEGSTPRETGMLNIVLGMEGPLAATLYACR